MKTSSSRMSLKEQNEIKEYWVSHSGGKYSNVLVWNGEHSQIPTVIGTVWNVGQQWCGTRRRTVTNPQTRSQ
jgi:hypothetical protein